MKHETSIALYEYWDKLRGDRRSALRTDIDPAAVKDHLPQLLTLKQTSDDIYDFILAGTGLFEFFGRELTGSNFIDMFSGKERESIQSLLYSVCEDQTACVVGFTAHTDDGREAHLEMIMLPISYRSQSVRVFGALSVFDKPHWIGMIPITSLSVASLRVIWPTKNTHFVDRSPTRRRDDARASYMPLEATRHQKEIPITSEIPVKRHGHLRVIEGGAQ